MAVTTAQYGKALSCNRLEALGHDDAEDGAIVKREAAGVNPARSILQSYGSAAQASLTETSAQGRKVAA